MPADSPQPHIAVVGGGIGGLAAAVDLASRGLRVTLLERQPTFGGKVRTVDVEGRPVDSGPTVLTLRSVFDDLFAAAGADLDERVGLVPAQLLARHAWPDGARLDLFVDQGHSRDAIAAAFGSKAGADYLRFTAHCRQIWEAVRQPFVFSQRPGFFDLVLGQGPAALTRFANIDAHRSMWAAVGRFFDQPQLQQLFGRYATYTGGSPFQTPGTLNLVAHVEQAGVWYVDGGMRRLAQALADLAAELGVTLRPGTPVDEITVRGGRVTGLRLHDGEQLDADAVVLNADASALARGLFGPQAAAAAGLRATPPARRSLSALTLSGLARPAGFSLAHHNVFFGPDSQREFAQLFEQRRVPEQPTVYLCAQDRRDGPARDRTAAAERIFAIVNAPARGDDAPIDDQELDRCRLRTMETLAACGLDLQLTAARWTRPQDFAAMFPATGGALYGAAPHGMFSSFQRPGSRTRLPGLYMAGGSVHPGAGLPMVAVSGRLASAAIASDLRWTSRSAPTATPGGTSTSSRRMVATG